MKRYFICITGLLFLLLANVNTHAQKLDAAAFEAGINQPDSIQVLDVRTPGEYASGHLQKALLADWTDRKEFDRRVSFIDKDKPVYVYCLAGGRSAAAAEELRKEGYTKVYELQGGINAWKAANKPLENKQSEKQMSLDEFNKTIALNKTILVDVGAEWCPPCKKMEPVLESLYKSNGEKYKLVKVDGGRDEAILKQYNITALPVFMVFKDGKLAWKKEGITTEAELAAQL